jgi:hypothetical protein
MSWEDYLGVEQALLSLVPERQLGSVRVPLRTSQVLRRTSSEKGGIVAERIARLGRLFSVVNPSEQTSQPIGEPQDAVDDHVNGSKKP